MLTEWAGQPPGTSSFETISFPPARKVAPYISSLSPAINLVHVASWLGKRSAGQPRRVREDRPLLCYARPAEPQYEPEEGIQLNRKIL